MAALTKEQAYEVCRATGVPTFVRYERREGWQARLPIYVRWCDTCRIWTEAHAAGRGRIHCSRCKDVQRVDATERAESGLRRRLFEAVVRLLPVVAPKLLRALIKAVFRA